MTREGLRVMKVRLYPADLKILVTVADERHMDLDALCRDIIGNWCVEQRAKVRLAMPAHHYSARTGVDEEAE
jgi:hypothetical protein